MDNDRAATRLTFPLEPLQSARVAGLRHVDPVALPGLARVRRGGGFRYVDAHGRAVHDAATLERVRKLAIPPAWRDVWLCPSADGHIQATGRDARGRLQYRYHERWREVRDATKYHKMIAFAAALPRIRAACRRDLARAGLPREKIVATAVRLLELTHIRVGNDEYTRANGSYGLTTLLDRHVRVRGDELHFHFRGKSGKTRDVGIHDRRLARIVARCSDLPGHELFRYRDDDGALHPIDSTDVNGYIHRVAGDEFTAKDFRTWAGTVIAARALRAVQPCVARGRANKNVVECIRSVAASLGNTPAVCKRSYVHPAIVTAYLDGSLARTRARGEEALVQAILRRAARMTDADRLTEALEASVRAVRTKGRGPRASRRPARAR